MSLNPPSEHLLTGEGFWGRESQCVLKVLAGRSTILLWMTLYLGVHPGLSGVLKKRKIEEAMGSEVDLGGGEGRNEGEYEENYSVKFSKN